MLLLAIISYHLQEVKKTETTRDTRRGFSTCTTNLDNQLKVVTLVSFYCFFIVEYFLANCVIFISLFNEGTYQS